MNTTSSDHAGETPSEPSSGPSSGPGSSRGEGYESSAAPDPARPPIRYHRMNFDFTGALDADEFAMEPVIEDGWATVMEAGPDVVIEGTLVDSPEGPAGVTCVVLDTPLGIRAFISSTLGPLVIENAPCVLEFRAVLRKSSDGGVRWDWEVHEISPNGCRILVSET